MLYSSTCYGTEGDGVVAAVSTGRATSHSGQRGVSRARMAPTESANTPYLQSIVLTPAALRRPAEPCIGNREWGLQPDAAQQLLRCTCCSSYALNPKRSLSTVCIAPPPPIPPAHTTQPPTRALHSLLLFLASPTPPAWLFPNHGGRSRNRCLPQCLHFSAPRTVDEP